MKATQVHVPGGPDALQHVELPEPVAGPGQVRVKAQAQGVCRPDVLMAQALLALGHVRAPRATCSTAA